jgi:hypothetical protein
MAEDRTIDELMHGRDIQPSPDAYGDQSSGDLSTADVAGAGSAT